MPKLTHFDGAGEAHMVDVGQKGETVRQAVASGRVIMKETTAAEILAGKVGKGDVIGIARVAAISGLKRTAELIPLCHPIRITGVDISIRVEAQSVLIRATVRAFDRTGVEMEALTAVSVAALTIYDMCKSLDRGMQIVDIGLDAKSGGKSGDWQRLE